MKYLVNNFSAFIPCLTILLLIHNHYALNFALKMASPLLDFNPNPNDYINVTVSFNY